MACKGSILPSSFHGSAIDQGKAGRWVHDFLLLPQGLERFPSDLPQARWHNLVCVICRWLSQWWLLFYWGLMFLWVMGVGFKNTCTVSGKCRSVGVSPRLNVLVCVWCESSKLRGRVSPRFPCVYWTETHLESCQTSTMEVWK